jgi:hypothetical protein
VYKCQYYARQDAPNLTRGSSILDLRILTILIRMYYYWQDSTSLSTDQLHVNTAHLFEQNSLNLYPVLSNGTTK